MEEGSKTCSCLLERLQHIWEVIGCDDSVRDGELLELERRCLALYEEAVAQAERWQSDLEASIANSQEEMRRIESLLREPPGNHEVEADMTLQEQERQVKEQLIVLQEKLEARKAEFEDVQTMILELEERMTEPTSDFSTMDFGPQRLEQLHTRLTYLQELKKARVSEIIMTIRRVKQLCDVMGFDPWSVFGNIHPSLCEEAASEDLPLQEEVRKKLDETVKDLEEEKRGRVEKISYLGAAIVALCHMMEITPRDDDLTACIGASVNGNFLQGMLSDDRLAKAEDEVKQLEKEQVIKVEDLVHKKMAKIEELCAAAHITPDLEAQNKLIELMKAGQMAPSDLLAEMEEEISRVAEAKISRSDILPMVERWQRSCIEVEWLSKFEQDENRYASKKAFKDLDRAEKARKEQKKLPGLVKSLLTKVEEWEKDRNEKFFYDGESLITKVEHEEALRSMHEEERKRFIDLHREEKRRQLEEEAKFGTLSRSLAARKAPVVNRMGISPAGKERRVTGTPGASPLPGGSERRTSLSGNSPLLPRPQKRIPVVPANVVVLPRAGKERLPPLSPRILNQQLDYGS